MSEELGVSTLRYVEAARVGSIAEGAGAAFVVDGRVIALFLSGGRYFAIDDDCPHQGASLSKGRVDGCSVTCAWHGWRYSLEDGRWLDNPRSSRGVATYPVRVVDDRIEVGVPVSETGPVAT